ncbi:50S ribosomal protein L4 [Chlamydiota bacterium]
MEKIDMLNASGKVVSQKDLDKKWMAEPINKRLLKDVFLMYQANKRQGCASTKGRSEVIGSKAKPWRQKGTGRARVGTAASPIWKGGGVVFGPKPRSFAYSLPKKARRKAREMALSLKIREGNLVLVEKIEIKEPKTKEVSLILNQLGLSGNILVVLNKKNDNVVLATRNIKGVKVILAKDINVHDILKSKEMLVTEEAFDELFEDRIKEKSPSAPRLATGEAPQMRDRGKDSNSAQQSSATMDKTEDKGKPAKEQSEAPGAVGAVSEGDQAQDLVPDEEPTEEKKGKSVEEKVEDSQENKEQDNK